jgi:parallel beta-helix repeat protein
VADFQAWDATSHAIVRLEDDWNNLLVHGLMKSPAFIVRKTGSYYEAINGVTGVVSYGGANDAGGTTGTVAHSVITAAITGAAGGHVHIKGSDYTLTGDIVVGQSGTVVTGDGVDTKLTQSIADMNVFSITTKTDVTLADMYLYGTGADTGCGVDATTTATDLTLLRLKVANHGGHGVQVINSDYPKILGCTIISNILSGLVFDTVDYGKILGCKINTNTQNGIIIGDSSYNLVSGNHIIGNDSADSATYDGVRLLHSAATADYNRITNNVLDNNDKYEINILTSSCTGNVLKFNTFNPAGDHVKIVNDGGTDTVFATVPLSFVAGGDVDGTARWNEFVPTTASAKGWQVNDAADFATATGQLPLDLNEIVRFKIWAVALGVPINAGGQMHLEINMNAGASNLAYTTEPVALANFDGQEADYVNGDVVSWYIDSGDDADIGSMVGGMSVEVEVIYEAGADPDGATNAVFRNIEIEYV